MMTAMQKEMVIRARMEERVVTKRWILERTALLEQRIQALEEKQSKEVNQT